MQLLNEDNITKFLFMKMINKIFWKVTAMQFHRRATLNRKEEKVKKNFMFLIFSFVLLTLIM